MKSRDLLRVQRLEDRTVPAGFGNPWPDADHLTLSFAPDGTDVGGTRSNLFGTLGAAMPAGVWQQEVVRAFQTWAQYGNLNVSVVSDNGSAFGSDGPVQGSPVRGDIRVSARPLSDNVLAVTTPFDLFSSWSGEIVINSNKSFNKGGTDGRYDLYTALLQEAGHALSIGSSPDTGSAMYPSYIVTRNGLSAGDVASVQNLYGARSPDMFDLVASNDTLATAETLAFVNSASSANATPSVATGDLTTLTDTDHYAYRVPTTQSAFTVAILTDGISQLRAKVTVFDPSGAVVQQAVVPADHKGAFTVTVSAATAGQTYRVKVEGATKDLFGIGTYRLSVGTAAAATAVLPNTTSYANQDAHSNDLLASATSLGTGLGSTDARWDFATTSSIVNLAKTDYDFYKVRTLSNTPKVAVIMVSALDATALNPSVEVYNKDGVRLTAEVLSNTGGTVTVQLTGVQPDTDYYVRVAAANPLAKNQGNYTLAIDFRDTQVSLTTFAAGTLSGAKQAFTSFQLKRTQTARFEVAGAGSVAAAVRMTVYDASGQAVLTLVAQGGQVTGRDVMLVPGTYTVRFVAANRDGTPLSAFQFRGRYALSSDPIGPELVDTTSTTTTTTTTTTTLYTYDASTQVVTSFLAPSDVYTAPAGTTSTTDPLLWLAPAPTDTFLGLVTGDFYSIVWW